MNIVFGKKQTLLAGLTVVLSLAVFVNWYLSDGRVKPADGEPAGETAAVQDGAAEFVNGLSEEEYFASVRLSRDLARDDAIEDLQTVMASAGEDEAAVSDIAGAIAELSAAAGMETDIEGLVAGKTGSNCVAVIGENSVDVVVSPSALSDSSVLAISDIIRSVCGDKYENVRISGTVSEAE